MVELYAVRLSFSPSCLTTGKEIPFFLFSFGNDMLKFYALRRRGNRRASTNSGQKKLCGFKVLLSKWQTLNCRFCYRRFSPPSAPSPPPPSTTSSHWLAMGERVTYNEGVPSFPLFETTRLEEEYRIGNQLVVVDAAGEKTGSSHARLPPSLRGSVH